MMHGRRDAQHPSGRQRAELLAEAGDRAALGQHQRRAAGDAHHAERGDERRQAPVGHQQPVGEAAGQPRGERDARSPAAPAALRRAPCASAIPDSASTDPTDKSMPPDTITNVMPTATIALIDVCSRTFSRFDTVRKCGVDAHSTSAERDQAGERPELPRRAHAEQWRRHGRHPPLTARLPAPPAAPACRWPPPRQSRAAPRRRASRGCGRSCPALPASRMKS